MKYLIFLLLVGCAEAPYMMYIQQTPKEKAAYEKCIYKGYGHDACFKYSKAVCFNKKGEKTPCGH